MTSLSRGGSSLNSSMTSLSIADNNSPLSSSLNLSAGFEIGETTKHEPKPSTATEEEKLSSEKKKKGRFRIPFRNRKRRGSTEIPTKPENKPKGRDRSQSLTPENLSFLSKIQEENAELKLAVSGLSVEVNE